MKVAFVTFGEARDVKNWSGTVLHMLKIFEDGNDEVTVIDQIEKTFNLMTLGFRFYEKLFKICLNIERFPFFVKSVNRRIEKEISNNKFDIVFSPSSIPLTYLKTKVLKVFWTDATFIQMNCYYPEFTGLSNKVFKWGNRHEKMAIHNTDLGVYSSDWGAKSAINDYEVSSDKVLVVPFGANLASDIDLNNFDSVIQNRLSYKPIKLLSIGNDWIRKGFDLTIQIAEYLHDQGYSVELSIAGAEAPVTVKLPSFVHHYGLLNKAHKDELALLSTLYRDSHFFVLPSLAECSAIVFAEASAFALPSLTRNTGGIPTMVENGVNGFVLNYDASVDEYAKIIMNLMKNKEDYKKLCKTTLQKFNDDLNWQKASEHLRRKLKEMLN